MTARLRWPLLLAIALGLAAGLWAIGRAGWASVLASVGNAGAGGFLLLCLLTVATFVPLGAAWLVAVHGAPAARIGRFAWARAAREAANDLLPFSQIGGLVVGARTAIAGGLDAVRVYPAMIVDLTTEMAGQLVLTLFALGAFASALGGTADPARLRPMLWAGLATVAIVTVAFVLLQRPMLRFASMLARRVTPHAGTLARAVEEELARIYARPGRVALSFVFNLAAWGMTALWAWLALRLMGNDTSLWRAAALEGAVLTIRSAAFIVPGALGVQEAAYALLAPVIGIDPADALALSLIRRARDVALGVPTLLVWQALELRAARAVRCSISPEGERA